MKSSQYKEVRIAIDPATSQPITNFFEICFACRYLAYNLTRPLVFQ